MMLEKQRTSGPNAGPERTDVEEQHQTHGINTHKYPVKPKLPSGFPVLSCMSHWKRKTILIVLSQTTFMLETNSQRGRLGFPEPWKCVFGNSILSLFNLLFYVFPLDYKAFKEKCCSTDKQVITIFRENKCLLSVIVENKQGGHL